MTKMERMSRLVLEITDHVLHCAAPRCLWLRLEPNDRLYSHKDDAARTERALRGHKNKRTKPLFQWNSFKTLSLHFGNVCLVFILFPSAHGLGILKSKSILSQSLLSEFSNFSQIFPLPPGGQVHLSWVQQLLHLHLQVGGQLLLDHVGQLFLQGLFVPALLLQKSDVVPDEEVVVGSHLGSVNVGGLMRPVDVAVANLLQTLINLDNIIIVFDIREAVKNYLADFFR